MRDEGGHARDEGAKRVRCRYLCGAGLIALLAAFGGASPVRAEGPLVVGVVDFYPGGTGGGGDLGVVPTRYVADDLSAVLAHAGAGQISVLPRAEVARAESALRWRGADVLSFARLGELAERVRADRLVVGWITVLSLDRMDTIATPGGQYLGAVSLVVQIFDPREGRLVWQTTGYGTGFGMLAYIVLEDTLRNGVDSTVAPTLHALTGAGT